MNKYFKQILLKNLGGAALLDCRLTPPLLDCRCYSASYGAAAIILDAPQDPCIALDLDHLPGAAAPHV
jgi:hypothetical protein